MFKSKTFARITRVLKDISLREAVASL